MKITHERHSANSSRLTNHHSLFTIHQLVVLSALILFFSLFSVRASAQATQSGLAPTLPSASAASYYYIAKPGEVTMPVRPARLQSGWPDTRLNDPSERLGRAGAVGQGRPGGQVIIWGFVQKPGRY